MNMELFQKELQPINENYPFSVLPSVTLAVQVIMGAILLGTLLLAVWQIYKRKGHLSTLFNFVPEIKNLVDQDPTSFINPIKHAIHPSSMNPAKPSSSADQSEDYTPKPMMSTASAKPPCNASVPFSLDEPLNPDVIEKLFYIY